MKKEEIIKYLITGRINLPTDIKTSNEIPYLTGYKNTDIVDLDKLVTFLAKYVVKEDLIEK